MIQVTPEIRIDEKEIQLDFVRSSGPGGQNVNKVSTAVQLRFDVLHSVSLPEDVRQRLLGLSDSRINESGVLIIDAQRYRTQLANRQEAIKRLMALVVKAAEKPRIRRKTRATLGSKERRLEGKRHRSQTKQMRLKPAANDD
jgi:ribosome-associated protein